MNCRKGDIARVKSGPLRDSIVFCASLLIKEDGTAYWQHDPVRLHGRVYYATADKILVPFKPQPEDAEDEVLQRVGLPRPVVYVKRK